MLSDLIPLIASQTAEEDHKYYPRPSLASPTLEEPEYVGRCTRQMVYSGLGYKPAPIPGRMMLIFDDGRWHEELTADWIRKSVYNLTDSQMEVTAELFGLKLTGHIDGILEDIEGNKRLYEHKALNHFTWNRYLSGDELPIDYLCQSCIYIAAIRQDADDEIMGGILLIKNKNTAQYMELGFSYDESSDICSLEWKIDSIEKEREELDIKIKGIVKSAVDKFLKVDSLIKKKDVPKRSYNQEDWQCQYCRFFETCWDGYEEEIKGYKDVVEPKNGEALIVSEWDKIRRIRLGAEKKEKALKSKIKILHRDLEVTKIINNGVMTTLKIDEKGKERLSVTKLEA